MYSPNTQILLKNLKKFLPNLKNCVDPALSPTMLMNVLFRTEFDSYLGCESGVHIFGVNLRK
jgi:hypothetical protein